MVLRAKTEDESYDLFARADKNDEPVGWSMIRTVNNIDNYHYVKQFAHADKVAHTYSVSAFEADFYAAAYNILKRFAFAAETRTNIYRLPFVCQAFLHRWRVVKKSFLKRCATRRKVYLQFML